MGSSFQRISEYKTSLNSHQPPTRWADYKCFVLPASLPLPSSHISLLFFLSLFSLILSLTALYNLNVKMFQVPSSSTSVKYQTIFFFYEKYLVTEKFFFSKLLKSANNVFVVNRFIASGQKFKF